MSVLAQKYFRQSIVINDARAQLEERIKMKFSALEFFMSKSLKNLYKQLEIIIQRLGEFELENNQLYHESFPCQLLEDHIDRIEELINKSMNLEIEQYFITKPNICFDENLRFESLQLLDKNTKVRQSVTCDHFAFCLIGNPIKKDIQTSMTFKIENLSGDVGFGICDLEIIKSHKFRPKLNQIGSGAFVLFQDQLLDTIHTENANFNWKTQGLKFELNDKIQVTFFPETKKIKWFNMKNQQSYELNLVNIQRQFNFCVVMKHGGSIVSIIE
ncbi:hypothetical protein pb186bvf_003625 [Paramecium bursaria]